MRKYYKNGKLKPLTTAQRNKIIRNKVRKNKAHQLEVYNRKQNRKLAQLQKQARNMYQSVKNSPYKNKKFFKNFDTTIFKSKPNTGYERERLTYELKNYITSPYASKNKSRTAYRSSVKSILRGLKQNHKYNTLENIKKIPSPKNMGKFWDAYSKLNDMLSSAGRPEYMQGSYNFGVLIAHFGNGTTTEIAQDTFVAILQSSGFSL